MLIRWSRILAVIFLHACWIGALPLDDPRNEKWSIYAQKLDHFDGRSDTHFAQVRLGGGGYRNIN